MIRVKCPLCGKTGQIAKLDDLPSFPFCSDRCKLVDLGRWIDGAYALPDKPQAETAGGPVDEEPDEEGD